MQENMLDGSYGEPREFNMNELNSLLLNSSVDHVDVFNNTPEEMKKRTNLFKSSISLKKNKKVRNRLQKQSRKNNR